MSQAEYLPCTVCGGETLHAVVRDGRGKITSAACKDQEHTTHAAESAILQALQSGSIDAADISNHAELRLHPRQAITRAAASLEAVGRVIVLRETGDRENPFPFSALLLADG